MSHFILDKAHRYDEPVKDPIPENGIYDENSGYWRSNKTGDPLVTIEGFRDTNTKKADRETGEDQKGE